MSALIWMAFGVRIDLVLSIMTEIMSFQLGFA